MASERRIDKARYDQVMWSRVCPGCGDHLVVDVARRSRSDVLDKDSRFLGTFHACGGPQGHLCWHMNRFDPRRPTKPLYEFIHSVPQQAAAK